jgi:hydrogenase nickel incorporation protein HypA/HybF
MHEVSLVRSLLIQAETVCEQHQGTAILGIEVEIGPLSGVEPLLVRDAFDLCSRGMRCDGTSLTIHEVPLKALCGECGLESELENFHFHCAHCGARTLTITQGEEFRLLNVTIEVEPRRTTDEGSCGE